MTANWAWSTADRHKKGARAPVLTQKLLISGRGSLFSVLLLSLLPDNALSARFDSMQKSFLFRYLFISFLVAAAITGCGPKPDFPVLDSFSEVQLERGYRLTHGLASCGFCHGMEAEPRAPLSGGRVFRDSLGEVRAANITPSDSGIGSWSSADVLAALRGARGKDGTYLSPDLHKGYEWMSDKDVYSIVAYLRSTAPVENSVERRDVGFLGRNISGFFSRWYEVTGFVPDVSRSVPEARGRYLVDHTARCGSCHNMEGGLFSSSQYLVGGENVYSGTDSRIAPNITGDPVDGLGQWSREEIVRYLSTGVTADGREIGTEFCPTNFFRRGSLEDLFAIASYLLGVRSESTTE
jgi:fructose 5-dehydrogenase cytochrome subunit